MRLKKWMIKMKENPNAKVCLLAENFNNTLLRMEKSLENSRKILLDLLETKRNKFPRFYFLSNEDLFEVLGQSKDPYAINKHINKFFPGIRKLDFQQTNLGAREGIEKKWQVHQMTSPDGEQVPLSDPQNFNRDIETSLSNLEKEMYNTVKKKLWQTYTAFHNQAKDNKKSGLMNSL